MAGGTKDAIEERLKGARPGWAKALLAAAVIGGGTAVVVFKLLRSEGEADPT
jgi:hypothetical protein